MERHVREPAFTENHSLLVRLQDSPYHASPMPDLEIPEDVKDHREVRTFFLVGLLLAGIRAGVGLWAFLS